MVTGLRPDSFLNLQLNAGVFLKNFDYSGVKDNRELLAAIDEALSSGIGVIGATKGGGSFQCTPSTRTIELDGMRAPFRGSTVNDMFTIKLTGVMAEITPQNFADALVSAELDDSKPGITTIKVRNDIWDSDYIPSLCWIGDTSSRGFVLINITNALNLTGANFTFADKSEGTLPFEFQAHQSDLKSSRYAPCEIVFFDGEVNDGSEGETP